MDGQLLCQCNSQIEAHNEENELSEMYFQCYIYQYPAEESQVRHFSKTSIITFTEIRSGIFISGSLWVTWILLQDR